MKTIKPKTSKTVVSRLSNRFLFRENPSQDITAAHKIYFLRNYKNDECLSCCQEQTEMTSKY